MLNPSFQNKHLTLNGKTIKVGDKWIFYGFNFVGYEVRDLISVGPFKYIKVNPTDSNQYLWVTFNRFEHKCSHLLKDQAHRIRYLNRDSLYEYRDGALQSVSLLNILRALSVAHATIWRPILMALGIALGVVIILSLVYHLMHI